MQITVIFALLLAILPLSMIQAAPLCSQVLQSEARSISDEEIAATITQLAQLKLDLDRAQARGTQDDTNVHHLLHEYPEKYRELVQGLQDRLSEKEIAQLIKKEIRQLQDINIIARKKTRERQKTETKVFEREKVRTYELISSSPQKAPHSTNSDSAVYIPKEKAIYFAVKALSEDFFRFNLKTGKWETVVKNVSASTLMKSGKTFLLYSEGRLMTYDLKPKQPSNPMKIQVNADSKLASSIHKMKLNPSGNLVLLQGYENFNFRYSVVNIATGKEILNQNDFPTDAVDVTFINDQQVAVIKSTNELVIIDTVSKDIVDSSKLSTPAFHLADFSPSMILSNDGTILTIMHQEGFISLNADNIHIIASELTQKNNEFTHISPARGQPRTMVVVDNSIAPKLVSMDFLNTESTFTRSSNNLRAGNSVVMSPDGQHALVIFKDDHPLEYSVYDHWRQNP